MAARLCLVTAKPTDAVTHGFLPAAARLGVDTVVVTDRPRAYPGAPAVAGCDVRDFRALISCLARCRPDAVFTNSDHLQAQVALAAAYLGLPGKDWRSSLRAKDKPLMRRRLAQTGTRTERVSWFEPGASPVPDDMPFPVVVKPTDGLASEDVVLVAGPDELADSVARIRARRGQDARLIAEQYLPGTLRTLETIGDGSVTWVLGGFRTELSPPPFFVERGLTWDPFEQVLRVHLGERLAAHPPPPRFPFAVASYMWAERPGLLVSAPCADVARFAMPGVTLRFWPYVTAGQRLSVAGSNRDYLGVVTGAGGDRAAVERVPSQFGMDGALLAECAGLLDAGPVRLRGLHAHRTSGLDAGALLASARQVLGFARAWCARLGVSRPEVNLGGGMTVDYRRPEGTFDWGEFGRGLAALGRPGETLRIEPGRAVTAYCGWYLTRVLDVKRSHGEAFAVVAGGTHHLRTPTAKGHDQPFAVIETAATDAGGVSSPVTVCGQLYTPKDILARRVSVRRLRTGDLLAFGLAGAYAWNISHHGFLMHPPRISLHILVTDVTDRG